MNIITLFLLTFLIVCAVAACLARNLLVTVIIFMGYSLVMAGVWLFLQSPDLAITEATVGAGVSSILFFLTLRRIRTIDTLADADAEREEEVS